MASLVLGHIFREKLRFLQKCIHHITTKMSLPRTFSEFFSYYDLDNLKYHFERHGYCSILSLTLVTKMDLEEMGIFDTEDQQDFVDAITDYDNMTYQSNKDTGMSCHLIDTPIIEFLSNLHSPISPESEADDEQTDKCITARRKLVFTNEFCNRHESGKKRKPEGQKIIGYHESSGCENFRVSLFPTSSDMKILGDDVDQKETDRAIDLLIQQMQDIVEDKNMAMIMN